jgi:hypothetical protein
MGSTQRKASMAMLDLSKAFTKNISTFNFFSLASATLFVHPTLKEKLIQLYSLPRFQSSIGYLVCLHVQPHGS